MSPFSSHCWSKYPALLYGLTVFVSASAAIFDLSWITLLIPIALLSSQAFSSLSYSGAIRIALAAILGISAFIYTSFQYQTPSSEELHGQAHVTFSSVLHSKTAFGIVWIYKGTLHSFTNNNADQDYEAVVAKNLPFTLSIPSKNDTLRPSTKYQYNLKTRLKTADPGRYILSLSKGAQWEPLTLKAWNLAEWRFKAKSFLRQVIYSSIKDSHSAAFLAGIATGEFDDRQLSFELGRFGLQHLMAISGLHFAILAAIIGFILQLIFSYKVSAYLLLIMLSTYFLFLGSSPSVIRAWITITIALMGTILAKRSLALNSLGVALFVMAIIDPFALQNVGFQFSFAVTGAILVWFAPFERMCQRLFAKRRLSEIAEMGIFSQHGYCLLYFLRQALALAIAVNLVAFPMTLYHFHKFPMMSLIYNLFFPFLMSLSMLMLLVGLISTMIFPWLANQIHSINEYFTQFMLSFAFNLPQAFDVVVRVDSIPKEGLIIYLIIVFYVGLAIKFSTEDRESEGLIFI